MVFYHQVVGGSLQVCSLDCKAAAEAVVAEGATFQVLDFHPC